jgi:uncharacterized protein (TIGR00297 family)
MVGVLILYGAGWEGGAVLAAFFVSSNIISRVGPETAPRLHTKGDRRDAWQVLANGGAAAVTAIIPAPGDLTVWLVTAGLSAAASDTWATAVGSRSRRLPRMLWTGATVPVGTSGGVTPAGFAGALSGALIVSATGAVVTGAPMLLAAGTLIGFLGMLVDSLVGGLFQGRFHCAACDEPSELRVHRCGRPTVRKAGVAWLTNDGVNFLATTLAVFAAWAMRVWFD